MESGDVQRYTGRPWAEIEASRESFWAGEFAEHGPETTLRASQSLWVHMRCVRPDWPSEAERAEDIAHHVELKRRLDQAGRGLGSRGRAGPGARRALLWKAAFSRPDREAEPGPWR